MEDKTKKRSKRDAGSSQKNSKSKTKGKSRASSGLRRVYYRNIYLLSQYRKINMLTFLHLILVLVSFFICFYYFNKDIPPRYIPLNDQNQVIQEQPLSSSNGFRDADVFSLTIDAIRRVNTYDYINYKEQLQNGIEYFTDDGWDKFKKTFFKSATLNSVRSNHLVVSVKPTSAPKITNRGVINSSYKWQVKQKVKVTYYENGEIFVSQEGNVTVLVRRVPKTDSRYGIGVETYVFDETK